MEYLQHHGIDLNSKPAPDRMPMTFNRLAIACWHAALETPKVLSARSNAQRWKLALQAYLKLCAKNQIYPFTGKDDFEDTARSFLKQSRAKLVRYLVDSGIFRTLKVRSTEKTVSYTASSFSITVKARLSPVTDPTFERFLTNTPTPGFSATSQGFTREVQGIVSLRYWKERGSHFLSYTVRCDLRIRTVKPTLADPDKLSEYLYQSLWLPAMREQRVESLGPRLF